MSGLAPKVRHPERIGLHVRIVLQRGVVLGPGRAELMQTIAQRGSIAAAARAMGMSYRRAWLLVDATSREFGGPIVTAETGGARGGGAVLTELGAAVLDLYRRIEAKAAAAVAGEVASLEALARAGRPDPAKPVRSQC